MRLAVSRSSRAVALAFLPLLSRASFIQPPPQYSPFLAPVAAEMDLAPTNNTLIIESVSIIVELIRRQTTTLGSNTCPAKYQPCTALPSASGACCTSNAVCSLDQAGHVACCPAGAACTGTISVNSRSSSSSSSSLSQLFLGGTTPASSASSLASSSPSTPTLSSPSSATSFLPPATTTAAPPPPGATSVVPNAYFPFAVIPTTYPNAPACSTAYSNCQSQYTKCASSLAASPPGPQTINGVTVSANAPGGGAGVTVNGGTTTLGPDQATSICQSLSAQACHGLILTSCSAFGARGNAAPTPCGPGRYGVGIGVVAVGLVGGVMG